nr:hypothetical protein CTI12_AA318980 [Tanacetum cinerariifolium]
DEGDVESDVEGIAMDMKPEFNVNAINESEIKIATCDDVSNGVMHCFVDPVNGDPGFFCSFVYASVNTVDRRCLWKSLNIFKGIVKDMPWTILGDFNVCLDPSEKSCGSSKFTFAMADFRDSMEEIEVDDIAMTGKLENGNRRISFSAEEVFKGGQACSLQLYGYFVGTSMDYRVVRSNLMKMWRVYDIEEITKTNAGIFYFKFKSEEGMKKVLESGPWMIQNEPGIWLTKTEPSSIPIWVCMYNIPLELCNGNGIGKIMSDVGKPLLMDKMTRERCLKKASKIDFARVLVEVSAEDDLPNVIEIEYPPLGNRPSRIGMLEVKYKWRPPLCTHCKTFGHSTLSCKFRPRTDDEIATNTVKEAIHVNGSGVTVSSSDLNEGFVFVGKKNKPIITQNRSAPVKNDNYNKSNFYGNSKHNNGVEWQKKNSKSSTGNGFALVVRDYCWLGSIEQTTQVMHCVVDPVNGDPGEEGLLKKLDRVLGNSSFVSSFPSSFAHFLPYMLSDHSPAVIAIPKIESVKARSFKFHNFLTTKDDFIHVVKRVWSNKVEWLNVGDRNSKYFHNVVKGKRNRNIISYVEDMEGNPFHGNSVGDQFVRHLRLFWVNVQRVSDEEIKMALFDIDGNKAPAIRDFFLNGKLLKEVNATVISLVPKVATPCKVSDYRPIACCNVIYKIISKVICNRIKGSLNDLVDVNQSAFIPSRQISDNILLSQELMRNYHRSRGHAKCAFKIDIEKAYDSVEWDFLANCLKFFGFHDIMVKWVMNCVSSASFTINVNDDLLLFYNGDFKSVSIMKNVLAEFSGMSGLLPNCSKSMVFFGNVRDGCRRKFLGFLAFTLAFARLRQL